MKRRLAYANSKKKGKYMSVVIVGGNECMTRQYKDICKEYGCKAKVYPKLTAGLKNLGAPDYLVLFTGTMSHKMLRTALCEAKGRPTTVLRSQSSSASALRNVLSQHLKCFG